MARRSGWLVVWLAVVTVGWGALGHGDERVHEPEGGFSYQKPAGWELQEAPGLRYRIPFRPSEGYAPNLKLMDEDFEGTLEEYVKNKKATLATLFPGLHQAESTAFETQAGLRGERFSVEVQARDRHLKQMFYLLAGPADRKFMMTCSSLADDADASIPTCDATVQTFVLEDQVIE